MSWLALPRFVWTEEEWQMWTNHTQQEGSKKERNVAQSSYSNAPHPADAYWPNPSAPLPSIPTDDPSCFPHPTIRRRGPGVYHIPDIMLIGIRQGFLDRPFPAGAHPKAAPLHFGEWIEMPQQTATMCYCDHCCSAGGWELVVWGRSTPGGLQTPVRQVEVGPVGLAPGYVEGAGRAIWHASLCREEP